MQAKIPAVYMRGGTSKAVFFKQEDLPADPEIRDRVILAAYGSPDAGARQIDGMGGATSSTSKVGIIGSSKLLDIDVTYLFGQVSVLTPLIDYEGNCGNIASAVGPFAIDEGWVQAQEPVTTVRIWQKNTEKIIVAEVPVKNGKHMVEGDYHIDGVPGSGSKIGLKFLDPGGSVTGKLLPTGHVADTIVVPGYGQFVVSIVDASNPVVFVKASDIGLCGTEIEGIDSNSEMLRKLEAIRSHAAVMIRLAKAPDEASPAVPKIAFVSKGEQYETISGNFIITSDIDLVVRIMSMGKLHRAFAATGAICTAGAAEIDGTVVNQVMNEASKHKGEVRIGHPSGIMNVKPVIEKGGGGIPLPRSHYRKNSPSVNGRLRSSTRRILFKA
ncbi:2-methylaconitate cis-trans isomerase PrpF family protein [Chloroflexota bacterium]